MVVVQFWSSEITVEVVRSEGAAAAIRVPTLVLAHRQDPIHRFAFGARLAAAIPGAQLAVLTPKSIAREGHAAEVQRCLEAFLSRFTRMASN